jgi:hypothetical protein
LKLDSGEVER